MNAWPSGGLPPAEVDASKPILTNSAKGGLYTPPETMLDMLRSITEKQKWKHQANLLLETNSFSSEFINNFHSTCIESEHHMRSQIGDDSLLLDSFIGV
jgi:hypothetical protein